MNRVREFRGKMSQEELARRAGGLSVNTIRKIEAGGNMRSDTALALAAALGVSVSELLGETQEAAS